jgi:hypothetical protein
MPARVTVPEAARANARLLQAAALRHLDDAGADATADVDGHGEARALLRLDRQQRFDRIDEQLATDEEDALLSVCG